MPHQGSMYDAGADAVSKLGGVQKGGPTAPPKKPEFYMQGTGAKDNETNYATTGYYEKAEKSEAKADPYE